jgi:hypothetical protein
MYSLLNLGNHRLAQTIVMAFNACLFPASDLVPAVIAQTINCRRAIADRPCIGGIFPQILFFSGS